MTLSLYGRVDAYIFFLVNLSKNGAMLIHNLLYV